MEDFLIRLEEDFDLSFLVFLVLIFHCQPKQSSIGARQKAPNQSETSLWRQAGFRSPFDGGIIGTKAATCILAKAERSGNEVRKKAS